MRFLAKLILLVAAATLASCASLPPPTRTSEPRFVAPGPAELARGGVALVLSGGAARGYAHVGVIKALEAHGLRPDLVVGSSAGSIVGALYASGLGAEELEGAIGELGSGQFSDLELRGLGILPGTMGVLRGDRLHRYMDDRVKQHRIEDFPVRFAAVATDLATGELQVFNAGDVGTAVVASSAVPGILSPAAINGRLYTDGQLSSPIPVDVARQLGARTVIAVDVIYPPHDASPRTGIGVLFQAFTIMVDRLKENEIKRADVVIAPEIERTTGQLAFRDRTRLIAAGEKAGLEAIPRLRPYFAQRAVH